MTNPTAGNEGQLDNHKIKEDWVLALNELANQIKQWVSELGQVFTLSVQERIINKSEEHIGEYKAPMLVINTGHGNIEVRPVGRFAIGAIGRVDITNNKSTHMFLYSRKNGWISMDNRKPLTRIAFIELFHKLLPNIKQYY